MSNKIILFIAVISFSSFSYGQTFKKKKKKNIYECGYVHKKTLKEKLNPMALLQKGVANSLVDSKNSDLGNSAISVIYQAHLHPVNVIRYVTKTPGYETCGDAVIGVFTNRSGIGLSSTDGELTIDGEKHETIGMGSYFYGFKPEKRGEKTVKITSSNGDEINVKVNSADPLEIISVDGKPKGSEIEIDGSKDIIIELSGGDSDPNSQIHVQLIIHSKNLNYVFRLVRFP